MRIALDAMGGDHAPQEIIAGAVRAAGAWQDTHIVLVGQEKKVHAELDSQGFVGHNIEVFHADEVVSINDAPTEAIRRKKKSSMKIVVDLVKTGDCQALVTAGNTGAMVGFCTLGLGRLPEVHRAGFIAPIPSPKGIFALVDAGANIVCTPEQISQYAVMASIYMREVGHVPQPRVGLLNIGIEENKGTPFIRETHKCLQANPLIHYVGYVEGHSLFEDDVDVALTDGFLCNVLFKISS